MTLFIAAAQSTDDFAFGLSGEAFATVLAAAIAALAAIAAAVIAHRSQGKIASAQKEQTETLAAAQRDHEERLSEQQQQHEDRLAEITRRFTDRQREADYRIRQLNELYGPLKMLTDTNLLLRESLPRRDTRGDDWRLVRHLAEAWANAGDRVIVDQIIEVNKAVEQLLITRAGLMESSPESFRVFMQHSRLLQLAWAHDGAPPRPSGATTVEEVPFPRQLDADIEAAIVEVRAALQAALAEG